MVSVRFLIAGSFVTRLADTTLPDGALTCFIFDFGCIDADGFDWGIVAFVSSEG
jgi:hypothetical protein